MDQPSIRDIMATTQVQVLQRKMLKMDQPSIRDETAPGQVQMLKINQVLKMNQPSICDVTAKGPLIYKMLFVRDYKAPGQVQKPQRKMLEIKHTRICKDFPPTKSH